MRRVQPQRQARLERGVGLKDWIVAWLGPRRTQGGVPQSPTDSVLLSPLFCEALGVPVTWMGGFERPGNWSVLVAQCKYQLSAQGVTADDLLTQLNPDGYVPAAIQDDLLSLLDETIHMAIATYKTRLLDWYHNNDSDENMPTEIPL